MHFINLFTEKQPKRLLNIDLSLEKQVFHQPFFRKTAEKVVERQTTA